MNRPTEATNARIAKLPVWAQRYLAQLEHALDRAEDERDDLREGKFGPPDTDTVADPYGSTPVSLPKGEVVSYRLGYGDHDEVRARVNDAGLEIMGQSSIVVIPQAANVVRVELRQ